MNIDLLIKRANEIGDFFAGTAEPEEAARAVANHLKRYWEPRMRAQMIAYCEQRRGAGLSDLARSAVAQLAGGAGGFAARRPGRRGRGAPPRPAPRRRCRPGPDRVRLRRAPRHEARRGGQGVDLR